MTGSLAFRSGRLTAITLLAIATACGGGQAASEVGTSARTPPPAAASSPALAAAPAPPPTLEPEAALDGGTESGVASGPACSPDILTDPKNCGRCDHDCLGGACVGGECAGVPVVAAYAGDFAIWDGHVYFVESNALKRIGVSGGAVEVLAAVPAYAGNRAEVLADATGAYVLSWDPKHGSLRRVPLHGGAPVVLATHLHEPSQLVADATHLYWVNSWDSHEPASGRGRICRVSRTGGAVEVVAAEQFLPVHLVVDGPDVYFESVADILRVPKRGGSVRVVFGEPRDRSDPVEFLRQRTTWTSSWYGLSVGIAVDASSVIFARDRGTSSLIGAVSKTGDPPRVLVGGQHRIRSFTTDDDNLYWGLDGAIWTRPKVGGEPRRLVAADSPRKLRVDGAAVYWNESSRIARVAK